MSEPKPVAWLHCDRREADVVTDAVKHVWGSVAVGKLAAYSIPLYEQSVVIAMQERIAELEKVAEAARELAAIKYPVYSGPKSADVKKGAALSGELLYYKVLPHLMHKLDKALLGGGE